MAARTMNNPLLSAMAMFLLAVATPILSGCSRPVEEAPLAGSGIGGPFTLIDQDGRKVSDSAFAGKYRLIYFGYTFCPDVCPVDVQNLMKGYRLLEQRNPKLAADVQPIFISVDPARDTPAVLRIFVRAFHPRLIGLTGSKADIAAVAKKYAIFYQKMPAPAGATGYLVNHSRQTVLFGRKGEPIALIPQEKDAASIAAEIERWAR
jgi:protein SCO1/2